jgi:hypothetical protein
MLRPTRLRPFERKNKPRASEVSFGVIWTLKTPSPFIKHSLLYFLARETDERDDPPYLFTRIQRRRPGFIPWFFHELYLNP